MGQLGRFDEVICGYNFRNISYSRVISYGIGGLIWYYR